MVYGAATLLVLWAYARGHLLSWHDIHPAMLGLAGLAVLAHGAWNARMMLSGLATKPLPSDDTL